MITNKTTCSILLLLGFLVSISQSTNAQPVSTATPSVNEIIAKAANAISPSAKYEVDVIQRIEYADLNAKSTQPSQHISKYIHTPGEGFERLNNQLNRGIDAEEIPYVFVDLADGLDLLKTYSNSSISREQLTGTTAYVIRGNSQDGSQACNVWIDPETFSIRQMQFIIDGNLFASVTVETSLYESQYRLPNVIELFHASDSSRVILEFNNYVFNK